MSAPLKPSSAKVQAYLLQQGLSFDVVEMPSSTRTAKDAASAIGCEVAQIAKSLIFKNQENGEPVLVVASGRNRVSLEKVEDATELRLSKADADFVRDKVGYAIGGVPPVAHLSPITTLLDVELQSFTFIWAAAGTPNSVFKLTSTDLQTLTGGRWIALAE